MKSFLLTLAIFVALFKNTEQQNGSFSCNVTNCDYCSGQGVCGLCSNNYLLTINSAASPATTSCEPVSCNVANCETCFQPNSCELC